MVIYPFRVAWGLQPISSRHWMRGRVQPAQVLSSPQGNRQTQDKQCRHTHVHGHAGDLVYSINLTPNLHWMCQQRVTAAVRSQKQIETIAIYGLFYTR